MARKLSAYRIALDLGAALRERLLAEIISELQAMQDCLLSGEDSGLGDIWNEVCVQQQREHSFSWRAYEVTMKTSIEYLVEQLKPFELDALWMLTYEYDDWDCEQEDEREAYPVTEYSVSAYLYEELLTEAGNWSNPAISRYLARRYS